MFNEMLRFELRFRFRQVSTYVYFGVMFLLGFLFIASDGVIGSATGKVLKNSPVEIARSAAIFSAFGMFITAALMGTPVYRDFKENIYALFYTTPIRKSGYLGGRFLGSLVATLFAFSGILVGTAFGTLMPWIDAEKLAPFNLAAYWHPFLWIILPNVLFSGAFFFAAYTLTRNQLSIYLSGIALFSAYLISLNLTRDYVNDSLAAISDPFMIRTITVLTKYWTVAEQNSLILPLTTDLLLNRLLWTGVGATLLALGFWRFHLSLPTVSAKRLVKDSEPDSKPETFRLIPVTRRFDMAALAGQYLALSKLESLHIFKSLTFIAITLLGIFNVLLNATQLGKSFGTITYPVTYQVLELIGGTFSLYFIIIITVYAGELIWRERELNLNQVFDALPLPNWVMLTAKLTALFLIVAALLVVLSLTGIGIQLSRGYTEIELDQYAKEFLINFIGYAQLCMLSVLIHTLVNQKFIGHGIAVLYYIATIAADSLGFNHLLYKLFAYIPYTYSDMNGYGHYVPRLFWVNSYYTLIAIFFALLSNLLWVRGTETSIGVRWILFQQRLTSNSQIALAASVVVIAALGGFIFYNTDVLNSYTTKSAAETNQAEYERRYKPYEKLPLPKITDVKVWADIFPDRRAFTLKGEYIIKNKTSVPVDSLVVRIDKNLTASSLLFSREASVVIDDKEIGFRLYKFSQPLQPGDTVKLRSEITYESKGFKNSSDGGFTPLDTRIVENGTFLDSDVMPSLGYDPRAELGSDSDRKKFKLSPKERLPSLYDTLARRNMMFGFDADHITYEAVVSTAPDQIAIAPGYLQKEWTDNGRRYFHYKMDAPIDNFYSFVSARYSVKRDTWRDTLTSRDIAIEVYYHAAHPYNVERMITSVKKSLAYFTASFGPYQHRQVRILEFPRYQAFAQSFSNTVPYSEGIGFITHVDADERNIDYPFYVTAHEVAHQWWGHQVIPGNVQGSQVMSESMAEYSALMVMEHEYGQDKMHRFLRYDLDRYLSGRRGETKKEMPLMLVENQPYIHYQKGSLVMYALRDYLGEARLNKALSQYLAAVKFQEPPYTTTLEFVKALRAATPDSLQDVITDMFETITLFENKATDAVAVEQPDGKFTVKLTVESEKLRADSLGNETRTPLNEWIDIGVFAEEAGKDKLGEPLYLKKVHITAPSTTIEMVVDKRPSKAGIDPYNKLIDRDPKNNTKAIELTARPIAVQ